MINGITLKVCGLTRAEDARAAAEAGADWLGFIFYPASPRGLTRERYGELRRALPEARRVAVCVEPTPAELALFARMGFDAFQVHFGTDTAPHHVPSWAETVGISRLWLAPKLPPGTAPKAEWLGLAGAVLLDAYHADKFGGTGRTGDWEMFRRCQTEHPGKTWILSGGLAPGNVAAALQATGARMIDVNSGVESAPGLKDPAKLAALRDALVARA